MNANHGREILFGFAEEMIHENHSKYLALSHLVISNAWDLKASQLDPRMGAYNEGDNEIIASATTAQLRLQIGKQPHRRFTFDLRLFSSTLRLRNYLNLKAAFGSRRNDEIRPLLT